MTRIEDRLRGALADEAETRTVDVPRLRADLDARLARPRRRSRTLPAAAAAVLLVGGGLVTIQVLGDDSPSDPASSGEVDNEFSCPYTEQVDVSGQDEFVPDLVGRTPAQVAREYDAPHWEFVPSGDSALLRLGNDDGTLGSETRYERRDDEWRMTTAVACSNGTAVQPGSEPLRLGTRGPTARPRPDFGFGGANAPVLVDSRPVYGPSGLVTMHRGLYLVPCGLGLCFATDGQDAIGDRMPTFSGRSEGILGTMCWFFVPDTGVGRASPYALMVAWDALGQTTGFSVAGPGGTYEGKSFTDPSWGPQQVWLALVPTPDAGVKLVSNLYSRDGLVDQTHAPVGCD